MTHVDFANLVSVSILFNENHWGVSHLSYREEFTILDLADNCCLLSIPLLHVHQFGVIHVHHTLQFTECTFIDFIFHKMLLH